MGVTSEILGNSGSPHQIEHNGKVFKVRLIDQGVQSDFEKRRLEKDIARLRTERELGLVTAEEFDAELKRLRTAFRAGDYEMMAPEGLQLMKTPAGALLILRLLVDCSEQELLGLMVAKQGELLSLLSLVIQESFPGIELAEPATIPAATAATVSSSPASGDTDPNVRRAAS